jgi:hypothetical protein
MVLRGASSNPDIPAQWNDIAAQQLTPHVIQRSIYPVSTAESHAPS